MRRAPEEPVGEVRATVIRQRLKRESRVRRHCEYRVIQAQGRRVHSAHYVWIVMPRTPPAVLASDRARGSSAPRMGIAITKRTTQRAVARNRVKRVLREVFRKECALFPAGCDVVVIGKAGADLLGYADALAELRSVAGRLATAGCRAGRRADPGGRNT